MYTIRQPLTPLFQRENIAPAPTGAGAAHDMLFLSTRPDLTPEFPNGLAHPSQRQTTPPTPRPGEYR
jgi:hypothetical protein